MNAFIFLGLVSALAGCSCIYLASPHQRWRAHVWPAKPVRVAGVVLLVISLAVFMQCMQTVVAVFTFAHVLMMLFILLPYSGALVSIRRGWQRS
jgi:hypothetical protein